MRSLISPHLFRAFLASLLLLPVAQIASARGNFSIKLAPAWVRKVVPTVDPVKAGVQPGKSSTRILDDQQIKVSAKSVERYYHYYQRVDNTAGLEDLSQLRFYFEPSYQQLSIHFVHILRGNAVINALEPAEVQMIQEEDDLDQQLYNGTKAALIFLNDVRVGDVVEYAYTITGDNPVLGGRFCDTIYLADEEPIQELFLRLVYPTKRLLAIKNDNTDQQPTKQPSGEDTEYVWYWQNIAGVTQDDSTPDWFNPYPRLTFSEFQTWADVVNWALPFYQNSSLKNPELLAQIEEWKKADSPDQRAIAALRFVQDDIRYLGIELGRYSHQPTAPEKVFSRRFGDCKDKSLLLSTILNLMGIEAAPALVSTTEKASLDNWQPTPFAFDHVIVQAKINGKIYWLDPTISFQRGSLANYYDPPFARGLVIRAGSTELEKIPAPVSGAGSIDIVEVYTGESPYSTVSLMVTKTYRGMEADEMRYSLSSTSLADLSKTHLNLYADTTPSIVADGAPVINDDEETNTIIIKEKYLISELWKNNRHTFAANRIYAELHKPRVSQRSTPLEINYPLSIRQTILLNLGPGYDFPVTSDVLTDNALRFEYSYSKSGNQLSMYFSLNTFADSVPPNALQSHLEILDKAQDLVGYELSRSRSAVVMAQHESPSRLFLAVTWLVILLPVALFIIWMVRRRSRGERRTQFNEQIKVRPGASPETAIRLGNEEQLESLLVSYSCRCGSRPYDSQSPPKHERFKYDGQRLIGIRLQCTACRETHDIYLNPLYENGGEVLADLSPS